MNPSPIRVMFVVPNLHVGGAERHVATLLPKMDLKMFTPWVVCLGDDGGFFSALQQKGVTSTAFNLGDKRKAIRALSKLVLHMKRNRPDVVIVRGYSAEVLGRIAARLVGVKIVIVWVHNIGDVRPRSNVRKKIDRAFDRWTTRYFGVAEAQRRYMVDELGYPERKIRIIYNGVDPASFSVHDDRSVRAELGLSETSTVVGIVAALRPEKDHATLLQAARIVVDAVPTASVLIVGDGPMRPELEKLCASLKITSNVRFAGKRDDISVILPAIDIFTLSSATVECFPISLLEAMACARPAVCTNVGGIGEMIVDGETGYLVPPRDPEHLAARLLDLLNNPTMARQMGIAGRQRLEKNFTLHASVTAAQAAIEEAFSTDL